MEKVKVSKELAMAIEKGTEVSRKEDFLKSHSQPGEWTLDVYSPLNKLSIFELAEILIKGYEVEETKEEQIMTAWNVHKPDMNDEEYCRGWKNGVMFILKKYDIKIEGIND